VFFTSESASGSSVDNLAPPEVTSLGSNMDGADLVLTWDSSTAEDFLYYSVFRDGEFLTHVENAMYVDSSMPYGTYVEYQVTATDENSNISDFSGTYGTFVNVVGDVNSDYSLNVLDLIWVVGYILGNQDFDDVQQTIADVDQNGSIDILDIVQLMVIIIDENSRVASNESEITIYKHANKLVQNNDLLIAHDITISHDENIEINLADAMVADMTSDGYETRIIILDPKEDVLFTTDGAFEIVEMVSASDLGYLTLNTIEVPTEFEVTSAYPNPFNPQTTIKFGLPEASAVKVSIYDINGRMVDELVDENLDAGFHSYIWSPSDVSSGVYIVHVLTQVGMDSQKIMLMK
jgi:hypothetical protein